MSQDATATRSRRGRSTRASGGKLPERTKVSLILSRENDMRLTVLAAVRGIDRSTLINTILDEALRGVVVSLRGPLSETSAGAGQGTPPQGLEPGSPSVPARDLSAGPSDSEPGAA